MARVFARKGTICMKNDISSKMSRLGAQMATWWASGFLCLLEQKQRSVAQAEIWGLSFNFLGNLKIER